MQPIASAQSQLCGEQAGGDPSTLLEKLDASIRRHPHVSGSGTTQAVRPVVSRAESDTDFESPAGFWGDMQTLQCPEL